MIQVMYREIQFRCLLDHTSRESIVDRKVERNEHIIANFSLLQNVQKNHSEKK